ncbi:MAG: response regulator, partial [Pseudomonadota bacterium]
MTEKQKILIVDDRKENLVALRKVLSDVDAEIVEATTGNQALAATLDHTFAVAILDVQMPGMNGYELAEHLRGDKNSTLLPIIFLTARYTDEQHRFKGYEAGGVDYITKPYSPGVLLGKLKIFLEMDRFRRELEMHRDHLETMIAEQTWKLNLQVREFKCLYAVSSLVAKPCESIDESLKAAVDLIPRGWQYSEITCARIVFEGREFT